MASTFSNLKFELIGTGDQSGTWGTTTNTNLGTAIEQALVGMATISSGFTGSPLTLTLTLTDTNAAQNARALVLNLTQALGSAGTLNVPAIQKPYMIINATGQTVTVKVTGLTGVAVPTGTRAFLYNNGTDVGAFFNYAPSLTLGTDLAVADGGTGASCASSARTNLGLGTISTQAANSVSITGGSITGITDLAVADGGTGASTACGARTNLGLGTIATQAASNVSITGGSITGITDLAVADGGTGASSAPAARTNLGATTVGSNFFTLTNPSAITFLRINADNTVSTLDAATFRTAIGAGTGGGSVSCVNTSGSVNGLTLTGGPITTTGTVTLGGGVNVSTITTGTLPVLYGGTGATTAPGALTNLGAYAASNPAGYAPGTVTSVATSGSVNGITLTGGPITSSGTVTLGGTLSGVNLSPGPTQQITGTLPVGNGGTGATTAPGALTNLGAYAASNPAGYAPGTVGSVGTSGSVNGLTLTGGPITTTGTVTLGGGVNVSTITTGTLPVARGGTGLCVVGTSGNVLTSNGTAWVSQAAGGGANIQSFPATGTYTKPPGAKFVMVELWGAGGGGGRTYNAYTNGGEGGGGGAYSTKMFAAPEVGATETVTVGAGGPGYTGTGQGTGGTGGTTNFGTLLYAGGGSGGSRLAGPCSYTPTGVGGNAYGPSVPTCYRLITSVLVWGGGPGGQVINTPGYPLTGSGKVSLFGGGGGAGGASFRTCSPGNSGGVGRLFGSNTSNLRTPTASTDYSGGGSLAPVDGGNFVGGSSQGGQGNPWPGVRLVNGNGGIAAGGAGQTMFFPNPGSSPNANTSGNGGNGYAVVYTW